MIFQDMGTVGTQPGIWRTLPKIGSSPELLLKISPQFDPALFAGFFWIKAYSSALTLPWRRYYPDPDLRDTLLDMRSPAALRQQTAWHHHIAVRYMPYRGSGVESPILRVQEMI